MAGDSDNTRISLTDILVRERRALVNRVRRKLFDATEADAEDLVSDVFLSILRRADVVSELENLTGYVYRAIGNRILDHNRVPKREQSLDTHAESDDPLRRALDPPSDDVSPEEALARKEERRALRAALDRLKPTERAVWIATEIEGKSFAELSEEWGEPRGTLLARKSRAGQQLRRLLSRHRSQ